MTDERRQDVLLFALVLSVMAHAALMFFMRPQVMTHVTGAGARSRARPPMKVREAVPLPDAVKFESVLDVDAERKSPEAEVDEPMPVAESFAAPEIALCSSCAEARDRSLWYSVIRRCSASLISCFAFIFSYPRSVCRFSL